MGKFRVILADPPWRFDDRLTMSKVKRGAAANYALMSNFDIENLNVSALAMDDSVLVLWVPSSLLAVGLDVMDAWGFDQKQVFTWVKTTRKDRGTVHRRGGKFCARRPAFGMGRLFRGATEIALVGTKGSPYKHLRNRSQRNVCFARNLGHSIKPNDLHRALDRMFDGPKLELFGRRNYPGWTVFGNEVTGNDIAIDIAAEIQRGT